MYVCGSLFLGSVERDLVVWMITVHFIDGGREMGEIFKSQNGKERGGNFETSKIQKKKRGGIIEAQKKLKK